MVFQPGAVGRDRRYCWDVYRCAGYAVNSEDLDRAEKYATAIIERSHRISPKFKEETRLKNPEYWLAAATLALVDALRDKQANDSRADSDNDGATESE